MLYMTMSSYLLAVDSQSWATVDAKVSETVIVHRGDSYQIRIYFNYTVDGENYTGRVHKIGSPRWGGYGSRSEAEDAADINWWVGKNFTAYYNPDSPSDSAIEPGSSNMLTFVLIAGAMMLGGILMAGLAIPKKRRAKFDSENQAIISDDQ